MIALSATAQGQAATTAEAAPASGRVVDEIDAGIWNMHQDRRGDFWFGSNGGGVFRYDGERITRWTADDGLGGDSVRGFADGPRGSLLVATTAGVAKFDGATFTPLEIVEPVDGDGWVLEPDDVWIVAAPGDGGPCRYDGEKLVRLELPESPAEAAWRETYPNAGFSPSGVYSVHRDRRGHVWLGTSSVGLCRFDGSTVAWMYEERLTTTPEGGAFGIRSIYEDRAGDFWIGNTRQRFRFAAESELVDGFPTLRYERSAGLPDAASDTDENFLYFYSVAEDEADVLWMACGSDGVRRFDGEAVTHYPVGEGALALRIFRDRDGELWVTTLEDGVFTFDGEGFVPFEL